MINQTHKIFLLFFSIILALSITACTDGERGFIPLPVTPEEELPADILITGGAVKGPLINAEVKIYKLELDKGDIRFFNAALKRWFDLLSENEVTVSNGTVAVGTIPASTVIANLKAAMQEYAFVSEFKQFKKDIASASTFTEANTLANSYVSSLETNTKLKNRVSDVQSKVATLKEFKEKVKQLKSMTDDLSEADSFSDARSVLVSFKSTEQDMDKKAGYDAAIRAFDSYRNLASNFSLSAIRKAYEEEIYDVFLQRFDVQDNPFSRQNILDLSASLAAAKNRQEAKIILAKGFDKESNVSLKQAISNLQSRIVTVSDAQIDILGRESLYHLFTIKSAITDLDVSTATTPQDYLSALQSLYESISTLFSNNFKTSLEKTLKIESSDPDFNENLLSFGVTNERGILEGLQINQYRGFVYMEVNALPNKTIDLNSGKKPIFEKMESIFHTDMVNGNGSNNEDKTLYFILNGVVQRDTEGKLITDKSLITTDGNDELLEIRPRFFASAMTNLALALSIEKLKQLDSYTLDANLDGQADLYLTEQLLTATLTESSDVLIESLGVGLTNNQNVFTTPALRFAEMKYDSDLEKNAIQHRLSIEHLSSFINEVRARTNLKTDKITELLARDLLDGQIDAAYFDQTITEFSGMDDFVFILQSSLDEKLLPDTDIPVSDTYYLMNEELKTTLPSQALSGFKAKRQDIITNAVKGGRDSDSDGILDNDDQFPDDPTKSRDLNPGYSGIWAIDYDSTDYAFIPFNANLTISLNKELVSNGTCSAAPCIALGDLNSTIKADYALIKAPARHDFVQTPFDTNNTIGFTAFATVPGKYLIRATFTSELEPVQRYQIIIPIEVIDPRSINLKFTPEQPVPGKTVNVQFEVTKGLCRLYSFCDDLGIDLDDNVPDFLDIAYLSDVFSVKQNIIRNDNLLNYTGITGRQNNIETSNLSNLRLNDKLSVSVLFKSGIREFVAKSSDTNTGGSIDSDGDGIQDPDDVFPNDANCANTLDGIQDTNLDNEINNLDTPVCFDSFVSATPAETEIIPVPALNETWYYNPSWHYIVRKNSYLPSYNGYIRVPTLQGTKQAIEHFLVDSVNKRVYFAYKNASIDYFSLESQKIIAFSSSDNFTQINSLHQIGRYLLVEYLKDTNSYEGVLYNPKGTEAIIKSADAYPKPRSAVTLEIDGLNFLSATNNRFAITWQLERENADESISIIPVQLSNDKTTLLSGQTLFGDVIKLAFSFTTPDARTIIVRRNLFVLNIDNISFSTDTFEPDQPLTVELLNFNPTVLASQANPSLLVNWYKNDASVDFDKFVLTDLSYPFILEESNFVFGDMIKADVILKHGSELLTVKRLSAAILGEIKRLKPELDESLSAIDIGSREVSFTLKKPDENNEYFTAESFVPVWRINGQQVSNESSMSFPTSDQVNLKYGDVLTVSYNIAINGATATTDEIVVLTFNTDSLLSQFELQPKVAEIGQSISIDPEIFNENIIDELNPLWRIDGEVDLSETTFTYPANKLRYGNKVELLITQTEGDISSAYTHIAEAYVGVNLDSLLNATVDPANDLDSDADGIPNHQDYFRFDPNCSAKTAGQPDDLDGDGIADLDELSIHFTNPNNKDTDNDLFDDADELKAGTNPLLKDTDSDGYMDGVESYLGTDPLDNTDPNTPFGTDNDFDGLSNEDELLYKTKVNVFDTDKDGLSDWYEINVSLTDPLNPDHDGDGLSDGLEVRVTKTNPTLVDSDGDTLSDGLEIRLGLNPLLIDSDSNGINDPDEAGFDFSLPIQGILYPADLPNYVVDEDTFVIGIPDNRKRLEAGSCYNSFIVNNPPLAVSYSQEAQIDASSEQQVSFYSSDWQHVIRYNAKTKNFIAPISLAKLPEIQLTSLVYDRDSINTLYLGFSDGSVKLYNDLNATITDVYTAEAGLSIRAMIDQGDMLLVEQQSDSGQIMISAFNKPAAGPLAKSTWNSNYSYTNSVWADTGRTQLLIVDPGYNATVLIKENFNSALTNPLVNTEEVVAASTLSGPLHIDVLDGNTLLRIGSGQAYNLTSSNWLSYQFAPHSLGLSHADHSIVALKNSTVLEMTTLATLDGNNFWRFATQLDQPQLLAIVPVGHHLLAISKTYANRRDTQKMAFQTIILGDENSNSVPDWWERLSGSLTATEFNNYLLNNDAKVPDFLNGDADIDDNVPAPILIDSDGDGICDHWEINLFGTNPFAADSDSDGASDFQELGIINQSPFNCANVPGFKFVSDPLNPDTDGDGLLDGYELFTSLTNPLKKDTDNDGLTDWQEINQTGTDPLNPDSNGDGQPDGLADSDNDALSDADELNLYQTDPTRPDSDDDGLSDFEEVITLGSNPNDSDTDRDGLSDFDEVRLHNTNPSKRDTDNDGLDDNVELNLSAEYRFSSNPLLADTDADGLSDAEEFNFVFDYAEPDLERFAKLGITPSLYSNPNMIDSDNDGICDVWEVRVFKTNPAESDTDFDGLSDAQELGIDTSLPVDCSVLPVINPISDPVLSDTDGDTILDGDEVNRLNTDPKDKDSNDNGITDDKEDFDGDGLNNYQELYLTRTDPFNPDTNGNGIVDSLDDEDNDGLTNIQEIMVTKTDPLNPDTNGNGLTDREEFDLGLDPVLEDTDGDGLTDVEEIALGTDPLKSDTDGDGISDSEEIQIRTDPLNPDTDHDFVKDGEDDFPLNEDRDGDKLPDGIEINYLNTNSGLFNTDGDSIQDGDEVWVFAFEATAAADPSEDPIVSNTLLKIGENKDRDLNSKASQANWPAPQVFADNGLDRRVHTLYDMADPERVIGRLFVQYYADPAKLDSDGDGLTDSTELAIETAFGNGFDLTLTSGSFSPLLSNEDNFKVSDPWDTDTDNNGISDAYEDIDGDYLINLLDQNNQETDVTNPDTDGDGILDGIEVLVLGTNPNSADTDGDGINDLAEIESLNIREVLSTEVCLDTEVRLSDIVQKDYCVSVTYISFPTLADSDNDGTPDRIVNEDSSITVDHYPLDPACHLLTDGFLNTDTGRLQCFSSWMADFSQIDSIISSEWVNTASAPQAEVIFHSSGWDKIIRYDMLSRQYLAPIVLTGNALSIDTVDETRSLYVLYDDGRLDRVDLETALVQTLDTFNFAGLSPTSLLGLNSGEIVLQFSDLTNLNTLYLIDQSGAVLDQLNDTAANLDGAIFRCALSDCSTTGNVIAFVEDTNRVKINLASIEIDLVSKRFNPVITEADTLSQFAQIEGPVTFSEDGTKVYLASGQILDLDLLGSDHTENLSVAYLGKTYTSFYDFVETGNHRVGLIDFDISDWPDAPSTPATRNGLIVKDISAVQVNQNKYLLPPIALDEEILRLFAYEQTSQLEVAVVSKLEGKIFIENLGMRDADNDGMPGIYEKFYGLDDENPNDRFEDAEGDGLVNIEEYIYATDPFAMDTDLDGWIDLYEVLNGTNPIDATSF